MSELETQKYLRSWKPGVRDGYGSALARLSFDKKIKVYQNGGLVGLKYEQFESDRRDPVVRECRGLVLDAANDFAVVAKPFNRFFEPQQIPEEAALYDWSTAEARVKEDGSLAILYYHDGWWQVNTSGSFGLGPVEAGKPETWRELFWRVAPFGLHSLKGLENLTLIFELCTLQNKVVRVYREPTLRLLAANVVESGEFSHEIAYGLALTDLAESLGVKRPGIVGYPRSHEQALVYATCAAKGDPTFEGVVVLNKYGQRLKIKLDPYKALAHMKERGVDHPRTLVPLAGRPEAFEHLERFPEAWPAYRVVAGAVQSRDLGLIEAWTRNKGIESQKEFALRIKDVPEKGILFGLRKVHGPWLGDPCHLLSELAADPDKLAERLFSGGVVPLPGPTIPKPVPEPRDDCVDCKRNYPAKLIYKSGRCPICAAKASGHGL